MKLYKRQAARLLRDKLIHVMKMIPARKLSRDLKKDEIVFRLKYFGVNVEIR